MCVMVVRKVVDVCDGCGEGGGCVWWLWGRWWMCVMVVRKVMDVCDGCEEGGGCV